MRIIATTSILTTKMYKSTNLTQGFNNGHGVKKTHKHQVQQKVLQYCSVLQKQSCTEATINKKLEQVIQILNEEQKTKEK